jgi:hypothetical protein
VYQFLSRNSRSYESRAPVMAKDNPRPAAPKDTMHQKRLHVRVRPTGRISTAAVIILGPKAPVINCTLVDYSAGGACIELPVLTALPPRFELQYAGTRKRCRVAWRRGLRFGLAF